MKYAGFLHRAGAGFIDILVLIPFMMALQAIFNHASREGVMLLTIPADLMFAMYAVWFIGTRGQTIGKRVVGIKVIPIDGSDITMTHAYRRSSVDILFAVMSSAITIGGLLSLDGSAYAAADFLERNQMVQERTNSWDWVIFSLATAWTLSELVVIYLNDKRRSIHDYIAGTVVVHVGK